MNIYYFNITVLRNRNVFGEVVKTLDDARAEKISRLRVTADKLRSAGAGILINFIKEKYNIAGDVKVDKFGKPYFEDTDIHFNISHSGCYVIAAVSDEDIGIDIQKIKSDKHRIAEKNFLPSECAYINEIEDEKINQQKDWLLCASLNRGAASCNSLNTNSKTVFRSLWRTSFIATEED